MNGFPVDLNAKNSNLEVIISNSIIANGSPFTVVGPVISGTLVTLFDIDVSGYSNALVRLEGTYTGQAISYEISINGSWFAIFGEDVSVGYARLIIISNSGSVSSFNTFGALRFRARVAVMASGEMTAVVSLSAYNYTQKTTVSGQTSDGTTAVGNPLRIGLKSVSSTTIAANNQQVDAISTLDKRLIVNPYTIPENFWSNTLQITNTTTASVIKAATASNKNYITSIQIAHDTLASATELVIRNGASGTVLFRTKLQTSLLSTTNIILPVPLVSSTNTLLEVAVITQTLGTIYLNFQGFIAS
jgi:hypothetical protein